MRSRPRLQIAASIALVVLIAFLWLGYHLKHGSHFALPFVELRFYQSADSNKPIYTLYLVDVPDPGKIVSTEPGLTLKRVDGLIEVFGHGDIQFRGRTIQYSGAVVSVDQRQLPAVLTRDGQLAIGSFLRRFDCIAPDTTTPHFKGS